MAVNNSPNTKQPKSEGITLVLSIILGLLGINGIGHIFVEQYLRGVIFLIAGLILYIITWIALWGSLLTLNLGGGIAIGIISIILYIGIFIFNIMDALKQCRKYNQQLS